MSEMVERVGDAIKLFLDMHDLDPATGFMPEDIARVAIKAMREPTLAMKVSGCRSWALPESATIDLAEDVWERMVDEALK